MFNSWSIHLGYLVHKCHLASHTAIDLTRCGMASFTLCFSVMLLVSCCSFTSAISAQQVLPPSFSQTRNAAVDYADVRARVAHAFPEKAHEMSAIITVLQTLSKETAALTESMHTHCGVKMGR